ncbi:MAG TPA: dihydrodipicolinate reductase C-terminal domain-containing protein [Pricia sp.]|nr:dihydrodipicolinate reductase C-terminal domain-containing protein [Pricia sp.]
MNIALFGYGKMGKMIEQIAQNRGHTIVAKIDVDSGDIDYSQMDVAIDFSMPDAAFDNISGCLRHGVPVICGTTGWLDKYDDASALCEKEKGAFIHASNFSLGVNVFFELNIHLARMMRSLNQYRVTMEEIHHTQKLDAPSGTAITLAEGIMQNSNYKGWELRDSDGSRSSEIIGKSEMAGDSTTTGKSETTGDSDGSRSSEMAGDSNVLRETGGHTIPVTSKRIGNTPGTHSVDYKSEIDTLEIKHTAHNREGFALGAVIAAEWIQDKTGVFTMKDVLGLKENPEPPG